MGVLGPVAQKNNIYKKKQNMKSIWTSSQLFNGYLIKLIRKPTHSLSIKKSNEINL